MTSKILRSAGVIALLASFLTTPAYAQKYMSRSKLNVTSTAVSAPSYGDEPYEWQIKNLIIDDFAGYDAPALGASQMWVGVWVECWDTANQQWTYQSLCEGPRPVTGESSVLMHMIPISNWRETLPHVDGYSVDLDLRGLNSLSYSQNDQSAYFACSSVGYYNLGTTTESHGYGSFDPVCANMM